MKKILSLLMFLFFASLLSAVEPPTKYPSQYIDNYTYDENLQAQKVIIASSTALSEVNAIQKGYWVVDSTTTISKMDTLFKSGQNIGNTGFNVNNLPIIYNVSGSSVSVPDGVNIYSSSTTAKQTSFQGGYWEITMATVTVENQITNFANETGGNLANVKTNTDKLNVNLDTRASETTVNNVSTLVATMNGNIDTTLSSRASETTVNNISTITAVMNGKITACDTGNITEARYTGKTSTGTCGLITNVTTSQITVTDNVANYSFKYKNSADISQYAEITGNFDGKIYLADGDYVSVKIDIPQAITFNLSSLSTGATMQYVITTLK